MALANPVMVDIPKDTWVLVAENVSNAIIRKGASPKSAYFWTYRTTGDPAPVDEDDAIAWRTDSLSFEVEEPGDIYVKTHGGNGRVRVERP